MGSDALANDGISKMHGGANLRRDIGGVKSTDKHGSGKEGLVSVIEVGGGEIRAAGESIGSMQIFTGRVYKNEVETREIFLPTCLTTTKLLRVFEIREVFVIG